MKPIVKACLAVDWAESSIVADRPAISFYCLEKRTSTKRQQSEGTKTVRA